MGYRKKPKTFVLAFEEGSEYEGLEVRARSISVGGLMGMLDLARMGTGNKMTTDDVKDIDGLFRTFAGKLESWNLEEEDGTPIALPDNAGERYSVLVEQDMDFVMTLVMAWLDGMVGTPGPLGESSNGGGRSEEVSLPMGPLSVNPQL